MVTVIIKKENNHIKSITLFGHAKFDIHGKDIVCAAISSSVITTVNGIKKLNDNVKVDQLTDKLIVKPKNKDKTTNVLLLNLVDLLEELSNDYPKNIKIKEE